MSGGSRYNRTRMRNLWLLLLGGVAFAGTYGGVNRSYVGYAAGVDCSVGRWSDHAAEARAFESCKQQAEQELTRREPELRRMYRHFVDGAHGRRALVPRLAPDRREGDWEHAVRVEVRFPRREDELQPARPISISLFVANPPSEALRARLAVDFAISQLAAGGALAGVRPRANADLADTQQLLGGLGSMLRSSPFAAVYLAAERRDEIAQLAQRAEPLPKKYAWQGDQRAAIVNARVLDAFLRGRAWTDEVYAMAARLDDAGDSAQLMALLLPDGRGLERVAALPKADAAGLRALANP
jgi:hypothetical protein